MVNILLKTCELYLVSFPCKLTHRLCFAFRERTMTPSSSRLTSVHTHSWDGQKFWQQGPSARVRDPSPQGGYIISGQPYLMFTEKHNVHRKHNTSPAVIRIPPVSNINDNLNTRKKWTAVQLIHQSSSSLQGPPNRTQAIAWNRSHITNSGVGRQETTPCTWNWNSNLGPWKQDIKILVCILGLRLKAWCWSHRLEIRDTQGNCSLG